MTEHRDSARSSTHVLVTGSTRGIGGRICEQLRGGRARVISHGTSSGDVAADLLQPNAADQLWQRALELFDGRIDVLINNAGIYEPVSIGESPETWHERWHRTMQINLQAAADLCRLAVSHFRSRAGGGRVVNVASRAAHRGDSPDHWHYAASKAALIAVTKTIARAYAAASIRPALTAGLAESARSSGRRIDRRLQRCRLTSRLRAPLSRLPFNSVHPAGAPCAFSAAAT